MPSSGGVGTSWATSGSSLAGWGRARTLIRAELPLPLLDEEHSVHRKTAPEGTGHGYRRRLRDRGHGYRRRLRDRGHGYRRRLRDRGTGTGGGSGTGGSGTGGGSGIGGGSGTGGSGLRKSMAMAVAPSRHSALSLPHVEPHQRRHGRGWAVEVEGSPVRARCRSTAR